MSFLTSVLQHQNPSGSRKSFPHNSSRNFTPSLTAMARAPGKHGRDQALVHFFSLMFFFFTFVTLFVYQENCNKQENGRN
jgi:hypothetical protein